MTKPHRVRSALAISCLAAIAGLTTAAPFGTGREPVVVRPAPESGVGYGWDVDVDGDVAVISDAMSRARVFIGGSVSIFRRTGGVWAEEASFTPATVSEYAYFGDSCAISGDTVAIGAPNDYSGTPIRDGTVFVYRYADGAWTQEARLAAREFSDGDLFGEGVAIDGDRIVVGSRRDDNDAGEAVGSTYVFERVGTVWTQAAKLEPSDPVENSYFGSSLAIEGDTAVVGSPAAPSADGLRAGAVYVYERGEAGWSQTAKLIAPGGVNGDDLGVSVAISGDTIIGGAFGVAADGEGARGAVYVWVRKGRKWKFQQRIDPPALPPNVADSTPLRFGVASALRGDIALIATNGRDLPGADDAGSAYLYVREGGKWTCREELVSPAPNARDYLGRGMGLSDDAAILGAPVETGIGFGAIFEQVPLRSARVDVETLALSLKYAAGAVDRATLVGIVPPIGVPASSEGQSAAVTIGPVTRTVTLDAKGKGASDDTTVIVRRGKTGRPASVTVQIRGDFSAELAPLGMDGSASEKKVRTPIVGSIDIGAGPVTLEAAVLFTGTAGKSGSAALTRK